MADPVQIPVDKLVKVYLSIRAARSALKHDFEKQDAELKSKLNTVAVALKKMAMDQGVEGFKTEVGTMYLGENFQCSCGDWGAFFAWAKEQDCLEDFMEKRLSSTAIKEYQKEHEGELPPGITVFREKEARVRAPQEK